MEIKNIADLIKWAISEEALKASIYMPKGCSHMNAVERITAEICVENLQREIKKKYKELRKQTKEE